MHAICPNAPKESGLHRLTVKTVRFARLNLTITHSSYFHAHRTRCSHLCTVQSSTTFHYARLDAPGDSWECPRCGERGRSGGLGGTASRQSPVAHQQFDICKQVSSFSKKRCSNCKLVRETHTIFAIVSAAGLAPRTMNDQRAATVVALALLACAGAIAQSDDRVTLGLYYESLCPDCTSFISKILYQVWAQLNSQHPSKEMVMDKIRHVRALS